MVSAAGIDPQEEKIQSIQDWPVPKCVRDVRAFFGLAFVLNFASIAESLSAFAFPGHQRPSRPSSTSSEPSPKRSPWLTYSQTKLSFYTPMRRMSRWCNTLHHGGRSRASHRLFLPSNEFCSTKLLSDSAGAACGNRRPPALPPLFSRGHSNFAY